MMPARYAKFEQGDPVSSAHLESVHPRALNQVGVQLRRLGKFDAAGAAYGRAIAADPGYALAHYNLGVLNDLYLRRLDTALDHYERYQALAGEDQQVTRWIADLRRRLGNGQRTASLQE